MRVEKEYEDETTVIPGTNEHFNYEKLKEMLENENINEGGKYGIYKTSGK